MLGPGGQWDRGLHAPYKERHPSTCQACLPGERLRAAVAGSQHIKLLPGALHVGKIGAYLGGHALLLAGMLLAQAGVLLAQGVVLFLQPGMLLLQAAMLMCKHLVVAPAVLGLLLDHVQLVFMRVQLLLQGLKLLLNSQHICLAWGRVSRRCSLHLAYLAGARLLIALSRG